MINHYNFIVILFLILPAMTSNKVEKKNENGDLNKKGALDKIKHMVTIGTAASLLFLNIEATTAQTSKGPENDPKVKNFTMGNLDYVMLNIDKYYPDMKEHTKKLIASIPTKERKDAVNGILQETVWKATDDKQRIGGTIYVLESYVLFKKGFGDLYDGDITDNTFDLMTEFDKKYDVRFDGYIAKLEAMLPELEAKLKQNENQIKQNENQIKQSALEIEQSMSAFTPGQIKKNPKLKKLVLDTEALFTKTNFPKSDHFKLLIQAAK